jgi:hypothetical protein
MFYGYVKYSGDFAGWDKDGEPMFYGYARPKSAYYRLPSFTAWWNLLALPTPAKAAP